MAITYDGFSLVWKSRHCSHGGRLGIWRDPWSIGTLRGDDWFSTLRSSYKTLAMHSVPDGFLRGSGLPRVEGVRLNSHR